MKPPIRAAVLTVSDRCFNQETADASGPALVEMLQSRLGAEVETAACVADQIGPISDQLTTWAVGNGAVDLIITTGGTGLAPRDVTPEATLRVLDREHPSLMQLIHMRCYAQTPRTFLSRGVAGTISHTLVVNLTSAPQSATEELTALLDVLPDAIEMLRGARDDQPHHSPMAR